MAIKVPMDPAAWCWRRRVLVPVLRVAVQGFTRLRRRIDRAVLDRLQLHLIAWREALDPASAAWIEEAKRSAADGSATERAWTTDDLRRLIDERRKLAR
jgi:hypothetical protein